MEQETQQPQENSQKKPLSGWRYYSPTDRRRWPPTGRQVLAAIAIVIALVSLSLIGYLFGGWPGAGQAPWVIGVIGAAVAFLLAVIVLTSIGYKKKWTGFGDKTVWNWLQLLIIPVVLAVGGLLFTLAQDARQLEAEERRAQAQLAAEEQRAQDEMLRAYMEEMGTLLLNEDLRSAQGGDEVRSLAAARTSTVLSRLDPDRKRSVVVFLQRSKLIQKDDYIVDLTDADLSDANLSGAALYSVYLFRVDLSDADLSNAVLFGTDLVRANLSGANLSGANLMYAELSHVDWSDADLSDADLSNAVGVNIEYLEENAKSLKGATMPNGSVHD